MPPPDHIRILLCTRNGAEWLPDQLESIARQTHPHWSLWISDDGSTDGTRAVIEAFDRRYPGRVERILDGPGKGAAANYLHLLCHPDLPPGPVALSDQDDVWLPEKLARAVRALHPGSPADSAPRAYAARFYVTDAGLRNPRLSAGWPRGPSFGNALVQNVMSGHSTVMNGAALSLVRRAGTPPVAHHDWWLYLLFTATGCEILLDREGVLLYRQHDENHFGDRHGRRARRERLRLLRRGSGAARWIAANIAALESMADELTPQARAGLAFLRRAETKGVFGRWRAFRSIGAHRQSRVESWVLGLAILLGRL